MAKKQYTYNHELMKMLPKLLGVKRKDMLERIGKTDSLIENCNRRKDIRVKYLIDICNEFQISVAHFFIDGTEGKGISLKDLRAPGDFSPVRFDEQRILDLSSGMVQGLTAKKIIEDMGMAKQRYYNWTNPNKRTIYASELAKLCSLYGVSPMYFFDDDNRQSTQVMSTEEYIKALLVENNRLKMQVKELEEKLSLITGI